MGVGQSEVKKVVQSPSYANQFLLLIERLHFRCRGQEDNQFNPNILMIGRLYPSCVKRINSRKHIHLDPSWNAPTAKLVIFIILVAFFFDLSLKYTIDVLTASLSQWSKEHTKQSPNPNYHFSKKYFLVLVFIWAYLRTTRVCQLSPGSIIWGFALSAFFSLAGSKQI